MKAKKIESLFTLGFSLVIFFSFIGGFILRENSAGAGGINGDFYLIWKNLDLFKNNILANKDEIINKFKIDISMPIILFTQHSVTTNYLMSDKEISPSLKALNKLSRDGYNIIITFPNNDLGSNQIIKKIKKMNNPKIKIYNSIGSYYYHGILNLNKSKIQKVVCVGNSSSGIKETPFLNVHQ